MSHEYDDHPVTNEPIEAAVTLTVELRSRRQSASIEELATACLDLAQTSRIGLVHDFDTAANRRRRWPSQSEHGKVQSDDDL